MKLLPRLLLPVLLSGAMPAAWAAGEDARDLRFQNRAAREELAVYSGQPLWQLLAGCSGFARAAAEYFRAHGQAEDQRKWALLSMESWSAAQEQLNRDRALADEAARPLINGTAEARRAQTALVLGKLDPKSGAAEAFAAETALLRGPFARLCIAASMETAPGP